MASWIPRFACPLCGAVALADAGGLRCTACGLFAPRRHGVYHAVPARRLAAVQPFLRQYRSVREREGYRLDAPEYYQRLPDVPPGDPHAGEWRLRRESCAALERKVLRAGSSAPLRVLDLGAGSGWLSRRLARMGCQTVAVDWLEDEADGLGACRDDDASVLAVQADFDALPFAPAQFDVVVFNASLHYAPDVAATLERADRMLAERGALVVMDSPMFRDEVDGQAMVEEKLRRFSTEYGLGPLVHPETGFLTFAQLADLARRLGRQPRFFPSRGPLGWRARRAVAQVRMRRAAARFGVWVAR